MNCPEPGAWRVWIDGESTEGAKLEDHLDFCQTCQQTITELRSAAGLAGAAISGLSPVALPTFAEAEIARRRIARRTREIQSWPAITRTSTQKERNMTHTLPLARWRIAAGGLVAALALTFLVATPDGRSAAAAFLTQFRSQRFTVVTVDPAAMQNSLGYLDGLGTVQGAARTNQFERVPSVAAATERVGFAVRTPSRDALPPALRAEPEVRVSPPSEVRFTFVASEAQTYLASIGQGSFVIPPRFDGVTLVVSAPPAVLLQYATADHSSGLMVGESRELTVTAEGGVTLDEFRDFLLSLPGLPPDTVRQLRAIQDWRNTVPIMLPVDQFRWQETTIGGNQGLILSESSGLGNAAIWQSGGVVYGVAGTVSAAELRGIADGLR